MTRKSYVQINGKLYEKAGGNSAIIDGVIWYNWNGTWAPEPPEQAALVMPDIQPYRSVIDGSVISSRSTHRAHLREHGCIEVGNERPRPPQHEWTATRGLREELIARINN